MGLRIKEVAEALGVGPDTLRYYERLGLLKPKRTESGYRLYDPETLERVRFIRAAQSLGLSLGEIHEVLEVAQAQPPCAHVRKLLREKLQKVREQVARLEALSALLAEHLAYAEAHPDPACEGKNSCVYLVAPGPEHKGPREGEIPKRSQGYTPLREGSSG